tara:strand:- start:161 stop:385 length:225 start_codon:yes stop_codon:yes gene_type:complete
MLKTKILPLLLIFTLGVLSGTWWHPPQPTVEFSTQDRNRIMWAMLEHLEENDFNYKEAQKKMHTEVHWYNPWSW